MRRLGVALFFFAGGVVAVGCNPSLPVYPLEMTSGAGGATSSDGPGQGDVGVGTGSGNGSGTGGASCAFTAAASFALPSGFVSASPTTPPFPNLTGSLACSGGADIPAYTLADLDGDGKLDLVFTQACNDTTTGISAWSWYRNSGTGFAGTRGSWTLPAGFTGARPAFADIGGVLDCAGGANAPTFTLVDVDGDLKLDLLVTRACDDTAVGTSSWWAFKNTGTGFAPSPTTMTLPSTFSGSSPPFGGISGALACTGGEDAPQFSYVDMDGDGVPDILVTGTCNDAAIGATSWSVYKGTGSSFASTPTSWALPTGYASTGRTFGDVVGALSCNDGANTPSFVLADMNADGKPDLLVTESCTSSAVGATQWLLYAGTGAGFSSTATTLALPSGYTGASGGAPPFANVTGGLACNDGANIPDFQLVDVNGDGFLDILVTRQCNQTGIGTNDWLYYRGSASGFGSATTVGLPSGYVAASGSSALPFGDVVGSLSCSGGGNVPSFTFVDLNGDAVPDIVVTERCNDAETGSTHWLLSASSCK